MPNHVEGANITEPTPEPQWTETRVRYSHYWPPWGGPNCARFVNGKCLSRTASGAPWEEWVEKGCACPKELPFGTVFRIDGREWTCVDRGKDRKSVV